MTNLKRGMFDVLKWCWDDLSKNQSGSHTLEIDDIRKLAEKLVNPGPNRPDDWEGMKSSDIVMLDQKLFHGKKILSLVSFDTDKIKSYVFGSPRLPQIRGASHTLRKYTSPDKIHSILQTISSRPCGCIIFAGGGSGLLILPQKLSQLFIKKMHTMFIEKMPGATVTSVALPISCVDLVFGYNALETNFTELQSNFQYLKKIFNYLEIDKKTFFQSTGFGTLVSLLGVLLRKAKDEKTEFAFLETPSILQRCKSCLIRPAQEKVKVGPNEYYFCNICAPRENEGRKIHDKFSVQSIEDLGKAAKEREGYIGIIYADGNGFGAIFEQLRTMYEYEWFSRKVESVFKSSVEKVEELGAQRYKKPFYRELPIRGGDDILMIVPADRVICTINTLFQYVRQAFENTDDFPDVFSEDIKKLIKNVSISMGVVIAHDSFPLLYLVNYAESLLKSAKTKRNQTESNEGWIDFMILTDSSPICEDIKTVRDRIYTYHDDADQIILTSRPYSERQFLRLLKLMKNINRSKVGRTQLYALRKLMMRSVGIANLEFRYQVARLKEFRKLVKYETGKEWYQYPEVENILWNRTQSGYQTCFFDMLELEPFVPGEDK